MSPPSMGNATVDEGGPLHEIVKAVRRGLLAHPDKLCRLSCFSVTVGSLSIRCTVQPRPRTYVRDGREGSWADANGKLITHHRVSLVRFTLYLYDI